MAYNGYGYSGYSPYYQNQQQDQGQNTQPSSNTNAYQSSTNPYSPYYQPTAQYANQSSERGQQYQTKPSVDNPAVQPSYYPQSLYTPARNDNSNVYAQQQNYVPNSQPSPSTGYGYANQGASDQNSRAHTDNSALGSLAYASTLGRSSPAVTQSQTSDSQAQTSIVGNYQMPQNSTSYQQSSTPASDTPAYPQRTQTPSTYANTRQTQPQQSPQLSTQTAYRPGLAGQGNQSRPGSAVSTRSPKIPAKGRPNAQHSTSKSSGTPQTGRSPAQAITKKLPAAQSSNPISTIMNKHETPVTTQSSKQSSSSGSFQNHGDEAQRPSNASALTSPINDAQPTTIDPNQIFDHAEYMRRKRATEEAEAAKRARETPVQATQLQASQGPQAQSLQQSQQPAQPQPVQSDLVKHNRTDSQSREQIQAEMKSMIEKMREYKSKDPAGFSEMWEQFKKVQPPVPARVASQTPQMSRASVPGQNASSREPSSAISPNPDNQAFPSPILSTITPTGGEDLPDLGKFPAMRRRTRADKGVSRSARAATLATARAITQSQSPVSTHPPNQVPYQPPSTESATPAPAPALDAGAESMRRAMQAFHNTPTPTPSSHQSSPPSQSKNEARPTIWPEDKKPELAEVAKKFLEELEVNKGKIIATADILAMLNQNPSYDQLCGMLSARGFQFGRAPFAQTLLSVVPSTSNSVNTTGETPPVKRGRGRPRKDGSVTSTPNGKATQAVAQSPLTSGNSIKWESNMSQAAMAAGRVPGNSKSPNPSSPSLPILGGTNTVAPEYKSYYEKMRLISGSSPGPGAPLTKQQMAKKRNFSELVDLSQVSDEETKQTSKKPRVGGMGGKHEPDPNQSETTIPIDPALEAPTFANTSHEQQPSLNNNSKQFDQYMSVDEPIGAQRERLRYADLAKPIDVGQALRRNNLYSINTLARDILIAAGKHPTERPLNFHLRQLAQNFRSVTAKSDLSTFRWDLVDPGDPPPRGADSSSDEETSSEDGRELAGADTAGAPAEFNLIDAAANQEQPKRLDSILTRGRGRGRPRGRPRLRGAIFSHFTHNELVPPKQNAAPTPVRGSLVSRGRVRTRGASRNVNTEQASSNFGNTFVKEPPLKIPEKTQPLPHVMDVDSNTDPEDEPIMQESPRHNLMVAASADVLGRGNFIDSLPLRSPSAAKSSQGFNPIQQVQRKRGRPTKNKDSSRSVTPSSVIAQNATSGEAGQKRSRGRPKGSKNSPFARKPGRPAKPQSDSNTTVPKDGIGVVVPSPSQSLHNSPLSHVERARLSPEHRPWSTPHKYTEKQDLGQYPKFTCAWQECKVELHNLDTLRRHIRSLHLQRMPKSDDGSLFCKWNDCSRSHMHFGDLTNLEDHVHKIHIREMFKRLGDGPTSHPTVVDPIVFLSDSTGKQVTPFATSIGPPDPLPLNAGAGPTKAYHKAHGNITKEQKANAIRESIRAHIARGTLPASALDPYLEDSDSEMDEDNEDDEDMDDEGSNQEQDEEIRGRNNIIDDIDEGESSSVSTVSVSGFL